MFNEYRCPHTDKAFLEKNLKIPQGNVPYRCPMTVMDELPKVREVLLNGGPRTAYLILETNDREGLPVKREFQLDDFWGKPRGDGEFNGLDAAYEALWSLEEDQKVKAILRVEGCDQHSVQSSFKLAEMLQKAA